MTRNKNQKAGAGKFLALLASLTMIFAGLVSVGLASPAAATETTTVPLHTGQGAQATGQEDDCGNTEGQDGWHFVISGQAYFDPASFQATFDDGAAPDPAAVSWIQTGTQVGGAPDGYVKGIYVSTAYGAYLRDASVQAYGADDDTNLNLSHTCAGTPPPVTETVYYCVNNVRESSSREVTEPESDWTPTIPEGAVTSDNPDLDCSPTPTESLESTLSCANWSVDIENYVAPEADNEVEYKTVELGLPVVVKIDTEVVADSNLDESGSWSGSGNKALADGSHTLTVWIDGILVEELTKNVTCTTTPSGGGGGGGSTPTPETKVVAPVVVVPAPAVVQPATIAAPVVVPAKPKPAKVNAPASVPAGVAKLPVSATVPGSVPAGNGPAAPALPMWALAMIALGALGAAGAGMRILGDRK